MRKFSLTLLLTLFATTLSAQTPTPTPTPGNDPITDMTGQWTIQFRYKHISDNPGLSGNWIKFRAIITADAEGRVSGNLDNATLNGTPVKDHTNGNAPLRGAFSCVFVNNDKCRGRSNMKLGWDNGWDEFNFVVDTRNVNRADGVAVFLPPGGGSHSYSFTMTR